MSVTRSDAIKARMRVKRFFDVPTGYDSLDKVNRILKKSDAAIKQHQTDDQKLLFEANHLKAYGDILNAKYTKGSDSLILDDLAKGVTSALTKAVTYNSAYSSSGSSYSSMPLYETSGSMPSSAYQSMVDRNNDLALAINRENNQFNADQAALTRSWQDGLANSAHQREVADLKAAGLNPVLSAGGTGAVTPSGATASNASYSNVSGDSVIGALASLASAAISANAVTSAASINAKANMYASDQGYKSSIYNSDTQAKMNSESLARSWSGLAYKLFGEDNFWKSVVGAANSQK